VNARTFTVTLSTVAALPTARNLMAATSAVSPAAPRAQVLGRALGFDSLAMARTMSSASSSEGFL
jgi:hypothetical protein